MTEFNRETVTETLHALVEEMGADYVYPGSDTTSCAYAEEGAPSCIVGHVIARLNPEVFQEVVFMEMSEGTNGAFDTVQGWTNFRTQAKTITPLTDDVTLAEALSVAQNAQDNGRTWGRAVELFEYALKNDANLSALYEEGERD